MQTTMASLWGAFRPIIFTLNTASYSLFEYLLQIKNVVESGDLLFYL